MKEKLISFQKPVECNIVTVPRPRWRPHTRASTQHTVEIDDDFYDLCAHPCSRRLHAGGSARAKHHSTIPRRYHDGPYLPTPGPLLGLRPRSKVECMGTDVYSCYGENLVVGCLEASRSCLIQGQRLSKRGVRRIQRDCGVGVLWRLGSAFETHSSPADRRLTMRRDGAIACLCLTLDGRSPTLRLAGRG